MMEIWRIRFGNQMGLESPSRQLDYYLKCIYIYTLSSIIYMASPLQSGILPFALYGLWIYDYYIWELIRVWFMKIGSPTIVLYFIWVFYNQLPILGDALSVCMLQCSPIVDEHKSNECFNKSCSLLLCNPHLDQRIELEVNQKHGKTHWQTQEPGLVGR